MASIKFRNLFLLMCVTLLNIVSGYGQVTIVNYDFNSGSSYGTLSAVTASNISCSVTSTEAWQVYTGTASGANAFTANATAGNALAMANSSGTNTRYFQFQLGGSELASYQAYKVYMQAQRSATGASTVTLAYSTNGTTFTNFATTQASGNGSFTECQFDLSSLSAINLQSAIYIRVLASGASSTGTLRVDNFQIRATKICTTPANVSVYFMKKSTWSSPIAVLTGSSTTSGITYSWSPGGATTSTISAASAGTYTLKVTNPVNGCSVTSTLAVVINTIVPVVTNYTSESSKGSISLAITGGTLPYNIAWNNNKLPSSTLAYHQMISSMAGLAVDSVKFKHAFDSIRSKTILSDLSPGSYSVTVYDQSNDSMALTILVPGSINSWPYSYGVTTTTCSIASTTVSAVRYHYGAGYCLSQQGTYTAGTHFVVQPSVIDFNMKNQINFGVSSTTAIVSVGLQAVRNEITGGIDDLSQKTMFNFKGDASYEIVFNNSAIKTGTIAANDRFSIRTSPLEGDISYYKNEVLLIKTSAEPIKESINGLIPKIAFGSAGAGVTGLQIIQFDLTPRITGLVTDVSCNNLCGGSLTTSGYYPLPNSADHYEIYDAMNVLKESIPVTSVNSVNFQNLCAGIYTVKYYFRIRVLTPAWLPQPPPQPLSAPITQTFEVAYMPTWANVAHVQVNSTNSSLVKDNTGTQAVYDAGASSENSLSTNSAGWLEWLAPQAQGANVIGLSNTDAGYNPTTTNYGVLLWRYSVGSGDARVYALVNNGVLLGVGSFTDADKFRLETGSGTNLLFKINGNTVGQFTNFQPNQSYIVDASMSIINGDINRPRLSFGCVGLEQYALPDKKLDGGYYTAYNQKVLFKYTEEYADVDGKLVFNIYNKKNEVVMSNSSMPSGVSPNVVVGDNKYILNVGNPAYWLSGKVMPGNEFYILEVINEKNEKWYLRFKKQ